MKERKLEIKYVGINSIKEYKNNAKEHPEWQVEQIANSIRQFGFNDPIAIDENNIIIEGHGRYLAANKLKLNEVPVIILKGLTEDEKRAYIIAHNKITMNTDFDLNKLRIEFEALSFSDIDLSISGFSDEEIFSLKVDIPEALSIPKDEENENGTTNTGLDILKLGKIKCKVTEEEYKEFSRRYEEYVSEKGTNYGFISVLLGLGE